MNGTLAGTAVTAEFHTAGEEPTIHASGSFGGGTVTCQFKAQSGNWLDLTDDNGNHIWTTAATRTLASKRPLTLRLSAVGVGNVYWEVR